MTKPHRIAAGAVIINNDRILLVRYKDGRGGSFLVGPGGGLEAQENVFQAAVRETLEETRIRIVPEKLLFVEDLQFEPFKMCKIWILAHASNHEIEVDTPEARAEGIIEAGWFRREQLEHEVVFPPPVMNHEWEKFSAPEWQPLCLPSRSADFQWNTP